MKKIIIASMLFAMTFTGKAQEKSKVDTIKAKISFEETSFNYGTLEKGADATHIFKFKNEGDIPLVLTEVKPSCGCTTPFWPKTPINPGESSEIKISYDSNRLGVFNKSITVKSNAENSPVILQISGEVK